MLRGLGAVLFALNGDTKQFVVSVRRNVIVVYIITQACVTAKEVQYPVNHRNRRDWCNITRKFKSTGCVTKGIGNSKYKQCYKDTRM